MSQRLKVQGSHFRAPKVPFTLLGTVSKTIYTVRNGHGNLDLYGKFTKNRLCSFVHSMGKKSHKCVGNFITDAMVILPYLKIYHENMIFLVNLP
jgi:hypothetical protein